jgi:hypothetical protein
MFVTALTRASHWQVFLRNNCSEIMHLLIHLYEFLSTIFPLFPIMAPYGDHFMN